MIELAELKAEKVAMANAQKALSNAQEKAVEAQQGQLTEKERTARLEAELQAHKDNQKELMDLARCNGRAATPVHLNSTHMHSTNVLLK